MNRAGMTNGYCRNPFDGATTIVKGTQLNHSSRYNDIMIYKANE